MHLDGDDVGGGGGEVSGVFDAVVTDYPADAFCFCFLGTIGAHNSDVSGLLVFGFGMVR